MEPETGIDVGQFDVVKGGNPPANAETHRSETAMSVASGAFFDLIEVRFAEWSLTPSGTEVALFTLKGLDIADIATARRAAQGPVRAQLAKVYAKADVSSRGQLTSIFIEDLPMTSNENSLAITRRS